MQTHFLGTLLTMKKNQTNLAPLIAIIGCDGSGKSTVSAAILDWMQGYGPAVAAHLGKQMGNIGRTIAGLPLIGKLLDQFIVRKTKSTQIQREKKTPRTILNSMQRYKPR